MLHKENLKKIKTYLLSLDDETRKGVADKMVENLLADGGPTPPAGCICEPETPYGHCEKINGVCKWVPEFGG